MVAGSSHRTPKRQVLPSQLPNRFTYDLLGHQATRTDYGGNVWSRIEDSCCDKQPLALTRWDTARSPTPIPTNERCTPYRSPTSRSCRLILESDRFEDTFGIDDPLRCCRTRCLPNYLVNCPRNGRSSQSTNRWNWGSCVGSRTHDAVFL